MKKRYLMPIAGCLLLLSVTSAGAEQGDIGATGKVGTMGVGAEIQSGVLGDIYARMGPNFLNYSYDTSINDLDYDMEMDFKNWSFLFDWYPYGGLFRATGGLFLNSNNIKVQSYPDAARFSGKYKKLAYLADSTQLSGTVEFDDLGYYAGMGWAQNPDKKGWGMAFDVGLLFQGSPSVSKLNLITPEGEDGENESEEDEQQLELVDDFLEEEEKRIEDNLDNFQFYPVVTLSVTYNF